MSKYKYEFYVSTNKVGSETSEEVDLVDDWGFNEEELDEMSDSEFLTVMCDLEDEFRNENAESGWVTPDGSREV